MSLSDISMQCRLSRRQRHIARLFVKLVLRGVHLVIDRLPTRTDTFPLRTLVIRHTCRRRQAGGPDSFVVDGYDARRLQSALVHRSATGNFSVAPADSATKRGDIGRGSPVSPSKNIRPRASPSLVQSSSLSPSL